MNYCHNCGYQLDAHINYCSNCGIKLESTERGHFKGSRQEIPDYEDTSQKRPVKLTFLSKNLSNKVVFTESSIIYKNIEIPYIDVWAIKCHSVKTTYNFVFSHHDYYFSVFADKDRIINIQFSSIFGIGNNTKKAAFGDLIVAADLYIFPILVKKFVLYVNKVPEPLQIGSLLICKKGLTRKGILKKSDFLSWEFFTKCDIKKGQIYVYKLTSKNRLSVFVKVPISFDNAILLPVLLETLKRNAVV